MLLRFSKGGASVQGDFFTYTLTGSKGVLLLLSVAILLRCLRSMLREKYDPETWADPRYGSPEGENQKPQEPQA